MNVMRRGVLMRHIVRAWSTWLILMALALASGRASGQQSAAGLRRAADHGRQHEHLYPRPARARELPARRAWRTPLFRQRLERRLYILDKQTKQFTTYLDFNGAEGRPGLFQRFSFKLNFATGLTSFIFDPDYAGNGIFYTLHMEESAIVAPAPPRRGGARSGRPRGDAGRSDAHGQRSDTTTGRP
jgi:hypothetical protein